MATVRELADGLIEKVVGGKAVLEGLVGIVKPIDVKEAEVKAAPPTVFWLAGRLAYANTQADELLELLERLREQFDPG